MKYCTKNQNRIRI